MEQLSDNFPGRLPVAEKTLETATQFPRTLLLGLGEYDEEKEVMEIQDSPSIDDVVRELDVAEELVNTFAVRAKHYWMGWGPVAMPMILTIDAWAQGQLQYLKWLRAGVLEL